MSVAGVLDALRARSPQVAELAETVSLAVRVEPELLRRARLELVPEADASAEADLWFSPIVDVQSKTAFMLIPDAADLLRQRLAANRDRLDRAWQVTREVHENAPPALALEEEVGYLLLAQGPESPDLQRRLQQAVVALVAGGDDRLGVARWALRALTRLPAVVAQSEAGLMLTVAARSRLGRVDVLPQGVGPDTDWLPWVLPREAQPVRVGVRLFDAGLELGPPDESAGHIIPLPRTEPLVLHIGWREGTTERRRYVVVRPERVARIRAKDADAFTLETAWGDSYTVRARTAPVAIAIRAHAGGREALVAWRPAGPIEGCLGFALHRRDADGREQVVENRLAFESSPSALPSTRAPIQRYTWLDGGLAPGSHVQYRVTPMLGSPGELREGTPSEWSDPVAVSTAAEPGLAVTWNRATLGLASVAAQLGASSATLSDLLASPGSETRAFLGGDLREGLLGFLSGVRESGGSLYAALYEVVNDPEVESQLARLGPRAHLLLGREAADRQQRGVKALQSAGVEVRLGTPQGGGLFHHRFAVATDSSGEPVRLWAGGANWTTIGLFLQSANAVIADSTPLAALFLEHWQVLAKGRVAPSTEPRTVEIGSVRVRVWFSPVRGRGDLRDVELLLGQARRGILFAMPFARLLPRRVADVQARSPLYVRGVATGTEGGRNVTVFRDGGQTNVPFIVSGSLRKSLALGPFNEFLARMLVIDPLGERPAVVTGSSNLSETGSAKNNEALLVFENAPALAAAHAVRALDLYRHYTARASAERAEKPVRALRQDDRWQDQLSAAGLQRELTFWLGATA